MENTNITVDDWGNNQLAIYCEGCKSHHAFTIGQNGWWFNFDFVNPTFDPSMLVNGTSVPEKYKGKEGYLRCHSFVRNGEIQYLDDCDHELKNTTRKLLPLNLHPSKYC